MEELKSLLGNSFAGAFLIKEIESNKNVSQGPIPGLIAQAIKEIKSGSREEPGPPRVSLDSALSVVSQLSCLCPRGKHDLAFFGDNFVLKTTKADYLVPYSAVNKLAIFDSIPKDTKGKVILYLQIDGLMGTVKGKAPLHAVVIQTTVSAQLAIQNPKDQSLLLNGNTAIALCQAFGLMGVSPSSFCSPDPSIFSSATKAVGVEAYVKARAGYLFPLSAGICFLESPAQFLPMDSIMSVDMTRTGGGSATFDIIFYMNDGSHNEFSNIDRSELKYIEDYIEKVNIPIGAPETSDEDNPQKETIISSALSSSSDEDEDFNPYASDIDKEEGGHHNKKRKFKEAARDSLGDDEEDIEEVTSSDNNSDNNSDSESDSGSVELVSEDDFSTGQLKDLIDKETE